MGKREEGQKVNTESNSVIARQDLSVESSQGPPATIGPTPGPCFTVRLAQFTSSGILEWRYRAVRPSSMSAAQETSPAASALNRTYTLYGLGVHYVQA
jgi:hypothetical protein